MQPTYLPWLGYFDLIDQADCFVFLDSVQFSRRSWQQRNRIKSKDGEMRLTVPVISKGVRDQSIAQVEIDQATEFHRKHLRSIDHSYAKAPYYRDYFNELEAVLGKAHDHLAELNIELIGWMCDKMGITAKMVRSSTFGVEGNKVNLLVGICQEIGAGNYLSPLGSMGYIEDNDIFASNGIELRYQDYHHPQYSQLHGQFLANMSALDLLMNEGPSSLEIIRAGRGVKNRHEQQDN